MCPELQDLADEGSLVLIQKRRFGPVPAWRPFGCLGQAIFPRNRPRTWSGWCRRSSPIMWWSSSVEAERAGIMYIANDTETGQQLQSSMFSLSGSGFFGAVGLSINLGGQTALALSLLLAVFTSKISSDNRPFGDEFRAARKVSEEIGAQIVLADRPIEITLERAWSSLKWTKKLSLLVSVIRGITSSTDISKSDVKELSSDDSTSQLYKQICFSYLSLLQPLIHERDTYLAWSLKRSKAVNNSKRVVGVIGKGHMNGIVYALVSDLGDLRFRDLAGYGSSGNGSGSWFNNILKDLVGDTVIELVLWALYEQFNGRGFGL